MSLSSILHRLRIIFRLEHPCGHPECLMPGEPCYLPNWGDENRDDGEPFEFYCYSHRFDHGYCTSCGWFNAGIENFDFGNGYCENCSEEIDDDPEDSDPIFDWNDY